MSSATWLDSVVGGRAIGTSWRRSTAVWRAATDSSSTSCPRGNACSRHSMLPTASRFRRTFRPAGDLFVVYNHNERTIDPVTGRRGWAFDSNQLLVKLQYAMRY